MKTKRTKGKFLSLLLAAVMAFCLFPFAAAAETPAGWDGTADTSWYNGTDTEFHLSTAEQLAGLAALVNAPDSSDTFAGKTVYLEADLDLSGHEWVSIGDGNNVGRYFGGVFDGQNHSISHLTSTASPNYYHGLFGVVSQGGTVKNIGVTDAYITTGAGDTSLRLGVLADWANAASILNSYTTGTVMSTTGDKLLGGLVGQCTAGTQITGCYSTAAVVSQKADSCDTVGGITGQWENATADALISDCWFGGSISCEYDDTAVGGIMGANFDFDDDQPGVTIRNCFVSTTDITCANPDNITWIAAVVNGPVSDCYWPVNTALPTQPAAVVKLVVDWDAGTADPDPAFDQSVCGIPVENFQAPEILDSLNANAAPGVIWVAGLTHPTFSHDDPHIPADYSAVEAARSKIPSDLTLYTDATVSQLHEALNNITEGLTKDRQSEVTAMAAAIETAVSGLIYKGADYSAVDAAAEKANALNPQEYKDFSAIEAALSAVIRGKDITEQAAVNAYAAAIEDAITALEYKDADYSAVDAAVKKANALNKNDYKDFTAVENALKAVVPGKNITEQNAVDAMAKAIEAAISGLVKKTAVAPVTVTLSPSQKPVSAQTTKSPSTGDSNSPIPWLILLAAAACALACTAVYAKKRKAK
ncbi:hypothetical protein ACTQW9_11480 [Lachnospiraceae bacterium LCP19S3_B12]